MIPAAFAQAPAGTPSALPLDILRPQHGEEARFPTDYVIGKLGRGDASEESYQVAKRIMAGLAAGNESSLLEDLPGRKRVAVLDSIKALGVRAWRIGGGRNEPDGSVSFLVRFLGREKSITGELYLRYKVPPAPEEPANDAAESSGREAVTKDSGTTAGDGGAAETAEAGAGSPGTVMGDGGAAGTAEVAAGSPGTAAGDGGAAETAEAGTGSSATVTGNGGAAETAEAGAGSPGTAAGDGGVAGTVEVAAGNPGAAPANTAGNSRETVETTVTNAPGGSPAAPARWWIEDVLLEPPGSLSDGKFGPGGADMTPYERFF